MPIDSAQQRAFSNEVVRPLAAKLVAAYEACRTAVDEWNAIGGGDFIANVKEPVVDGAGVDNDGRPVIDGEGLTNVIVRAVELVTDYEADGKAKLATLLKVAARTQAK